MIIEYKNGKSVIEQRDTEIGRIEALKRKEILKIILPLMREQIEKDVGDIFTIQIVGSVSTDMCTEGSDIDLLITPRYSSDSFAANLLVTASLFAMNSIKEWLSLPYLIDLWFREKPDNDINTGYPKVSGSTGWFV